MEQSGWILWLILGICLIVAEIFTLGFVLLWFGIGALAAAFAGILGFGAGIQFLVFAIVSVGLTAMSRTILNKYLPHSGAAEMKSGVDALPGQVGTVSIGSSGAMQEAAVKVFGSTWTAYPMDDEQPLMEGQKVEVVEVRGSSIMVRPVNRKLRGWQEDET
jgi:membrane protein implicated in regulation of membrane protease activity